MVYECHLRTKAMPRLRLLAVCLGCAYGLAPSPTRAAPPAEHAHAEPIANPFAKYLFGGRVASRLAKPEHAGSWLEARGFEMAFEGPIDVRAAAARATDDGTAALDEANARSLRVLKDAAAAEWDVVKTTPSGVTGAKRTFAAREYDDAFAPAEVARRIVDPARAAKFAGVRGEGVIDAPPAAVFALFLDNARVRDYNKNCADVRDLALLDATTKLTWARTPRYGPFPARDFVTVTHFALDEPTGTLYVVNRPAEHAAYPRAGADAKYCRAEVLLGGQIIAPRDGGRRCHLTTIGHFNPGGKADNAAVAAIINTLCARDPVAFIEGVRGSVKAAQEEGAAATGAAAERVAA